METLSTPYIRELLFSPESEFKDIGIQQVISGLPDTCHVALEYLTQCPEDDASLLSKNLKTFLPFLRSCFSPRKHQNVSAFALFDRLRINMDAFLTALQDVMKDVAPSQRQTFLKRLSEFPGIAGEIHQMTNELWGTEQAHNFIRLVTHAKKHRINRQLMLFGSYTCNLQCSYCFAQNMQAPDMSLHDAREILDWAQNNDVAVITFCGGEPTIYPHFPILLDELKGRGLRTYFATNLLTGPGVLEKLHPDYVDALIVHVAHPETYTGNQWQIFQENIQVVRQQGVSIALRINLYKRDHDWSHLFRLAEKFELKEVQLALTFPNAHADNRFVQVEEFGSQIPSVLQLMESCKRAGLRAAFSKPLPLCLFPDSMRYEMLYDQKYSPTCSVFMDEYTHNVCISPRGDVSPCLALLDIARPFSQFRNWDDLSAFCRSEILPILRQPLLEQCPECFLFARGLCQGACLGHKKKSG